METSHAYLLCNCLLLFASSLTLAGSRVAFYEIHHLSIPLL